MSESLQKRAKPKGASTGLAGAPTPRSAINTSAVSVTRSAKVWQNGTRKALVMAVPKDVAEMTGVDAGDTVLVTGMADGRITVVRADNG